MQISHSILYIAFLAVFSSTGLANPYNPRSLERAHPINSTASTGHESSGSSSGSGSSGGHSGAHPGWTLPPGQLGRVSGNGSPGESGIPANWSAVNAEALKHMEAEEGHMEQEEEKERHGGNSQSGNWKSQHPQRRSARSRVKARKARRNGWYA